jgi:hypothetical protein
VYEIAVRVTSVIVGFLLAYVVGCRSIEVVLVGFIVAPFLVSPVWRIVTAALPPKLESARRTYITLDLS